MSRSKPTTKKETIAKRYFKWLGQTGGLSYYDKDLGENVEVDLPMTFMVLDELATVKGWSDEAKSAIWANEVRNTMLEPFTLFTSQGRLGSGIYSKEIKGKYPVKYHKSIYVAYYENDEMVIGNISLKGSAAQVWGDFCKENQIYKGAVTMGEPLKVKNGSVTYFVPTFSFHEKISEQSEAKAQELDQKLQKYLNEYFDKKSADESELHIDEDEVEEIISNHKMGTIVKQMDDEEIPF